MAWWGRALKGDGTTVQIIDALPLSENTEVGWHGNYGHRHRQICLTNGVKSMKTSTTRRQFLFKCGASGVAVLGAQALAQSAALAAELEPLSPSGPMASALGYVVDATTTDTAKFSRYEAGQDCSNCLLYQGAADSESGGCPLFAGKSVAAKGWCNSWALKAS